MAGAAARLLGVTGRGRSRDRSLCLMSWTPCCTHFEERRGVAAFALFSTRRLDEITRISWADLDEAGSRVMVRDMKNPGEKIGNDV